MDYTIYKITCIANNKVYIGQTFNFKQRMCYHKTYLKRNSHTNQYLQRAYNKYGKDSFVFEIVEICQSKEIINEREIYWINYYQSCEDIFGFNIQLGGHDRPSERGLLHLREKAMQQNKRVMQFDLEGNKLAEFESIKLAAKTMMCTSSEIVRACKRELIEVKNFQWRYFSEVEKLEPILTRKEYSSQRMCDFNKRTKSKPIIQKTLSGEFICEHPSIIEATRINNFKNQSQITNCLIKYPHCHSAYGYLWEYKS